MFAIGEVIDDQNALGQVAPALIEVPPPPVMIDHEKCTRVGELIQVNRPVSFRIFESHDLMSSRLECRNDFK